MDEPAGPWLAPQLVLAPACPPGLHRGHPRLGGVLPGPGRPPVDAVPAPRRCPDGGLQPAERLAGDRPALDPDLPVRHLASGPPGRSEHRRVPDAHASTLEWPAARVLIRPGRERSKSMSAIL